MNINQIISFKFDRKITILQEYTSKLFFVESRSLLICTSVYKFVEANIEILVYVQASFVSVVDSLTGDQSHPR